MTPNELLRSQFDLLLKLREVGTSSEHDECLRFVDFCRMHLARTQSQLLQECFVQFNLDEKRNGFFVEFGATDGIQLSNTYVLEKFYGWRGILAEPATCWHSRLRRNRDCIIDLRCIWDKSGEVLEFNETGSPEFSTINAFSGSDMHAVLRASGTRYDVTTVSLSDMLREYNAPTEIDYLSIDTEGSELRVLSAFDFDRYNVNVITVEHNYTDQRAGIHTFLTAKGFVRKFEYLSQWDDWYLKAS